MAKAKGNTVIVIDDDNDVSDVLGGLLEIYDFPVKTYLSAQDFIDDASVDAGCLVVDQNMPGMSGLELVAKLHAERQPLPTLIISGDPSTELLDRAKELGVAKVLSKPMSHRELVREIEACLSA